MDRQELTLVKINDPFDRTNREIIPVSYNGENLLSLRDRFFCVDEENDVVVSVNGKVIPKIELEKVFLHKGDYILLIPTLHGGGGIMRMAAMVIVAVAAAYTGGAAAAAYGGWATLAGAAAGVATSVAVSMVGGLLVNAILPPPGQETTSGTQVYSWNPQTTQLAGTPIPKLYGESKAYGNIISAYSEILSDNTVFNQNYMNLLIAISLGPIQSITNMKINDQLYQNYRMTDVNVRLGRLSQAAIPNFENIYTEYTINTKVTKSSPKIYITEGNAFDHLEVVLSWPEGAYYQGDRAEAATFSYGVYVSREITPGSETWMDERVLTVYSSSPDLNTVGNNPAAETYWLQSYRKWDGSVAPISPLTKEYDLTLHYEGKDAGDVSMLVSGIVQDYPTFWTLIKDGVSQEPSVDITLVDVITKTVTATTPFTTVVRSNVVYPTGLPDGHGRYKIRVTYSLEAQTPGDRYYNSMYVANVKEVVASTLTFPRMALVGIRALATDQLSGSIKFSCIVKGSLVFVNGASTATYSDNPAWVCYDILTQPVVKDDNTLDRYEGINPSFIDLPSFKTWADFCDVLVPDSEGGTEKRFTFNGGFDSQKTLWDIALEIARTFRATLVISGYQISAVVDTTSSAVQLFSVGNVIVGSFQETFLSLAERAGEIEVAFMDSDKDYQRNQIGYYNTSLGTINKVSIPVVGVVKATEAWRIAKFQADCNNFLRRVISFKVDIDALGCTVGDVFNFQHDVPRWGIAGGRLVSATSNTVTLDQEVTLLVATTYKIAIRLSTDVLVEKTITSAAGAHTTLSIAPDTFSSIPILYDVYALGISGIETKPFRVIDLSQESDTTFEITAMEYNASVYSVDGATPVVPGPNYTNQLTLDPVTNLDAVESFIIDTNGVTKQTIIVTFDPPQNSTFSKGLVYYQISGRTTWEFAGSNRNRLEIFDVLPLTTYTIMVVADYSIAHGPFSTSPLAEVTTGIEPSYNSVVDYIITGLQILGQANDQNFYGKDCFIVWQPTTSVVTLEGAGDTVAGTHVPPLWFKDYEVAVYGAGVLRRTDYVDNPNYAYTYDKNVEDGLIEAFEIRVKARDRYFRTSNQAAILQITNTVPDNVAGLAALPIVGGVQFVWDRNDDLDLQCYQIRTKVSSGGTFSAWTNVETNKYDRHLTAAEVTSYTNLAVIYAEVVARDAFNQVSATAATANAKANTVSDNLFQLVATLDSGITGTASSLYDGVVNSGGVTVT